MSLIVGIRGSSGGGGGRVGARKRVAEPGRHNAHYEIGDLMWNASVVGGQSQLRYEVQFEYL